MDTDFDFLTIPKFEILGKDFLNEITNIESLSNTPSWTDKMFEAEFIKDNAFFHGVFVNNILVGFLLINTVVDEAHILKFGILPEYRGQGLGKKLLEYSISEIKKMNEKYVWLEVRKSNEVAIHLYSLNGFKVNGERKEYYTDNNEDAYIMVLNL